MSALPSRGCGLVSSTLPGLIFRTPLSHKPNAVSPRARPCSFVAVLGDLAQGCGVAGKSCYRRPTSKHRTVEVRFKLCLSKDELSTSPSRPMIVLVMVLPCLLTAITISFHLPPRPPPPPPYRHHRCHHLHHPKKATSTGCHYPTSS